jgi:hypothetical protein
LKQWTSKALNSSTFHKWLIHNPKYKTLTITLSFKYFFTLLATPKSKKNTKTDLANLKPKKKPSPLSASVLDPIKARVNKNASESSLKLDKLSKSFIKKISKAHKTSKTTKNTEIKNI